MSNDLVKVTMGLTNADVANAERLRKRFGIETKAQAVSTALDLTALLADIAAHPNFDALLHVAPNGEVSRVVIPGLVP